MGNVSSVLQTVKNGGKMNFISYLSQKDGYFKSVHTNFDTTAVYMTLFSMAITSNNQFDVLQTWNNNGIMSFISYLAKGGGYFTTIQTSYDGYPTSYMKLFPMDIDGDGKSDVLQAWNNNNKMSFVSYLSIGDGNFKPVLTGYNQQASSLEIFPMDINGDGKSDVLQVWNNGIKLSFVSYLSRGDGSYSTVNSYYPTTYDYLSIFPMDINGDGKSDVLQITDLGNNLMGLTSYFSQGDGYFRIVFNAYQGIDNSKIIFPMDINGDGKSDALQIWSDGSSNKLYFTSYLSKGDGAFQNITTKYDYVNIKAAFPIYLNLDVKTDLLIIPYSSNMMFNAYLSKGDGTFSNVSTVYTESNDYMMIFPMETNIAVSHDNYS